MVESFLFLFTGIIGLVTIALMVISCKSNPFCNAYLSLIIIIVSFRFLIHASYKLGIQTFFLPDHGTNSILYLIIVPCFYLYYKNLVHQNKTYNPKDLKHFIFIAFLFLINTKVVSNKIFDFSQITNSILVSLFLIFYTILIFKMLSKNIWFKKDTPINNTHFRLIKNWSFYLFALNLLAAIRLLVSIYIETNSGSTTSGKSFAVFLLFPWLFIYFKILISPEILYGLPILNKKLLKFNVPILENEPNKIAINSNWTLEPDSLKNDQDLKLQEKIKSNILGYIQEIDTLSNKEFVFRNPNFSTSDLANTLGVPTSHIVYLFKYHSNISFSEYRMRSRIQDAINLIESDYLKLNTLESLAYKTGFASYNPFFSAFKKVTACAPHDYLKNKNNLGQA